jgi:hypothetical protein
MINSVGILEDDTEAREKCDPFVEKGLVKCIVGVKRCRKKMARRRNPTVQFIAPRFRAET